MGSRGRKGDPKLAIGYMRASKEDQLLSPEVQRAAIEQFLARQGVRVAAWFLDHGVHGDSDLGDRPGLAAALVAIREHGCGLLCTLRRDRVARDSAVAALIDRAVAQCGARIVTADGVANGDGPADVLLRGILDSVSAFELAQIRSRTRSALRAKRARGELAGKLPFGYALAPDGVHLIPDRREQAVLRDARDLRQQGLSFQSIADRLGALGYVGRTGRPYGKVQVFKMLRSDARAVEEAGVGE